MRIIKCLQFSGNKEVKNISTSLINDCCQKIAYISKNFKLNYRV